MPAVSQGLNRDSLKSLNLSRFSGFAVAPYLSVLGSRSEHNSAKFLAKNGVLGEGKPRFWVEGFLPLNLILLVSFQLGLEAAGGAGAGGEVNVGV